MIDMKQIFILFFLGCAVVSYGQADFDKLENSLSIAQKENKNTLLVFTGSDWCKPCIALKRNILETATFQAFSQEKLIVYNADFPYKKKNKLARSHQEYNDSLAAKYNPKGIFPAVILIDQNGQALAQIDYKKGSTVDDFIQSIKNK